MRRECGHPLFPGDPDFGRRNIGSGFFGYYSADPVSKSSGSSYFGRRACLVRLYAADFFHNPIAGPFILGISSGAKLTVSLVMVFFLEQALRLSSLALIGAAFVGAMISMGFVLLMARVMDRMSMLIVSGVMIGYICSAITDFVVTFAEDADIVNLHNWSKGSFSGISWENIMVLAAVIFTASFCVFLMSKPISAYQMGRLMHRIWG